MTQDSVALSFAAPHEVEAKAIALLLFERQSVLDVHGRETNSTLKHFHRGISLKNGGKRTSEYLYVNFTSWVFCCRKD